MDGYADFFSAYYTNTKTLILSDGTSVQFPPRWTQSDADLWREKNNLVFPGRSRGTPVLAR